jgi:hypothetical protein
MNEDQLKALTGALQDIEELHKEAALLKMKQVAMFAAVSSSLAKANINFELDETYLNDLLERAAGEEVPFATQEQIGEDTQEEDPGPTVISNTGEVATFSNGVEISRQRPASWPKNFVRPGLHAGLAASATLLSYHKFLAIFAKGNTLGQAEEFLANPSLVDVEEDGVPKQAQKFGGQVKR